MHLNQRTESSINSSNEHVNATDYLRSNPLPQNAAFAGNGLPHKPMSTLNHEATAEDHYSGDGINSFYKMGQPTPDRPNAQTTGVQDHTTTYPPPVYSNSAPFVPQNNDCDFTRPFPSNSGAVSCHQFDHPAPVDSIPSQSGVMLDTNCRSDTPTRGNYFTQPHAEQSATVPQSTDVSQPQLSSIKQNHLVPSALHPTIDAASLAYKATSALPTNSSGLPPSAFRQQQYHHQQQQPSQYLAAQQHVPNSVFPPSATNTFSPPSAVHNTPMQPVYPHVLRSQTQPVCYQSTVPSTTEAYADYRNSQPTAPPPQSFGYSQQQPPPPPQSDLPSVQPIAPAVVVAPPAYGSGGSRVPSNTAVPGSRPVSQISPASGYQAHGSHSRSSQSRYPTMSSAPVPNTHMDTASKSFRTTGSSSTRLEWDSVTNPIGLLHERNILPSDGADLPPRPAIQMPVNCDPDIMRCTLNNIPSTQKLLSTCRLPLGLVLHPFRDLCNPCIVNSSVIARCRSCRTYINPFVQFIQGDRRWRCSVCFVVNEVPEGLYYHPSTNVFGHPSQRPEVRLATVEYIAPDEYMLRPPQPATYLFCFDVSRNAVATGYLHYVCSEIAALLPKLPGDSRRRIGFLTFNSAVHFYKMCGDSLKMIICPDVSEPFIPESEGLINRIEGTIDTIQDFLRQLPDSFTDTSDVDNCLGTTLQIGLKMIGNSGGRIAVFNTCLPTVGVGSLQPREQASGGNIPEAKQLGPAIDFYKTLALECSTQQVAVDMFILNSQYSDIATLSGICRFSSGSMYHYPDFLYDRTDRRKGASTHGGPGEETTPGSQPAVSSDPRRQEMKVNGLIELERLRRDLKRYLTRKIGFEAVMRVRCTHGLSIMAFHGSFFVRSADLMSLPNINPDAGFAIQMNMSESLENCSAVCIQAAILYTSSAGDRRIRVHTLSLPVVNTESQVFAGADAAAITCLIGKMAVDRAISSGLANARDGLVNAVVDSLSAYASTSLKLSPAASATNYGIACPPNLRLLPLYVNGLLRYRAFSLSRVRLDDRSAAFERLKSAPFDEMLALFYPRLYAVHNIVTKPIAPSDATLAEKAAAALSLADYGDARPTSLRSRIYTEADDDTNSISSEDETSTDKLAGDMNTAASLPGQLRLSRESIQSTGVHLLDTGELLLLLVGAGDNGRLYPTNSGGLTRQTDTCITLKQLLGVASPSELPAQCGPFTLPPFNPLSEPEADVPIARRRLCALIALLRRRRPTNSALVWMRHDAAACLLSRFISAMVEDRSEFSQSYQEFLVSIQQAMGG